MAIYGTYTSGSANWSSPGVTSVTAYMWGGGGAGGGATGTKSAGGGGAGGAYVVASLTVAVNGTYPVVVGAGGVGGTLAATPPGGTSWFAAVGSAYAPGGIGGTRSTGANVGSQGGAGGTTGAIGTLAYAGGNGGNGVGGTGAGALAGAGGGGAADTGVGGNASGTTQGTGANTGGGLEGLSGGTAGAAGGVGATYGAGGGGGFSNNTTDRVGGTGGAGAVILSWEPKIVYGTVVSGQADAAATGTLSVGIAGTENLLVFLSANERNAGYASITSAAYNGTALTFGYGTQTTSSDDDRAEAWYMFNPGVGTRDLVFTYDNAPDGYVVAAQTYGGVKEQAPEVVAGTAISAPTSGSVSITTLTSGALLVGLIDGISSGVAITTDTTGGQVERFNVTNADNMRSAGGDKIINTAGASYMRWTFGAANDCSGVVLAFAPGEPAPPPGTAGPYAGFKSLLGVGL